MELQELGPRARQADEQLGPIGRVRGDDADRRGARYVTVGNRASQRGADQSMGEVVQWVTPRVT
jgi:hypothetical protein